MSRLTIFDFRLLGTRDEILAMIQKSMFANPSSRRQSLPPIREQAFTVETERRMSLPSGLSALIQAATSQLGHLANEEPTHDSDLPGVTHSDDGASSDGGERAEVTLRTPTMVPEPDPQTQTFPELLMTLAVSQSKQNIITFLPDGKFFAIRRKEFAEDTMLQYFDVDSFASFLDLLKEWGFSRILREPNDTGIEVFRHPRFVKGDWERVSLINFGESPNDARLCALPEHTGIDYTISSDDSTGNQTKRRLSPGFLSKRESQTSASSQKLKREVSGDSMPTGDSCTETDPGESPQQTNSTQSDDYRTMALTITTEKLKLKQDEFDEEKRKTTPLAERALESATFSIVSDAIESLLRDETHTKETYLKHKDELSTSTIPGVIPISKQLFSPKDEDDTKSPPKEVTTAEEAKSLEPHLRDTSSLEVSPDASPKRSDVR